MSRTRISGSAADIIGRYKRVTEEHDSAYTTESFCGNESSAFFLLRNRGSLPIVVLSEPLARPRILSAPLTRCVSIY